MNPILKILISYHKKATIIKNDYFIPIQAGRAVANQLSKDGYISKEDIDWLKNNMIGDDTGDNVSHLNRHLCEITTLYWAWKNYDKIGNPDYIGFMHYRRYLMLNSICLSNFKFNKINAYYSYNQLYDVYKNNNYNIDNFVENISKYDIYNTDISCINRTVNEDFIILSKFWNLDYKIFEECIKQIILNFPQYNKSLDYFLNSKQHHWYNCFIMRKDLFFEYSEFLCTILLNLNSKINYENATIIQKRMLSFISERLFGLFVTHKTMFENKKNKVLKLVFFEYTDSYKMNVLQKIKFLCKKIIRNIKLYIKNLLHVLMLYIRDFYKRILDNNKSFF